MNGKLIKYLLCIIGYRKQFLALSERITDQDRIMSTDRFNAAMWLTVVISSFTKRLAMETNFLASINCQAINKFRDSLDTFATSLGSDGQLRLLTRDVPAFMEEVEEYLQNAGVDSNEGVTTINAINQLQYLFNTHHLMLEQFDKHVDSIYDSASSELRNSTTCKYSIAVEQFPKWLEAKQRLNQ
jgi:hypothetical protein